MEFRHLSVMPDEVIRYLAPHSGGIYVDGTLGGGGHSGLILASSAPSGRLIGFDRDDEALAAAKGSLAIFGDRALLVRRNAAEIAAVMAELGIEAIDGLLLDLGVSSHQLDSAERGFSFQQDAALDMRMDRSGAITAAELVNQAPEAELAQIIREYGEERWARQIARRIVAARLEAPLETTGQLAGIVSRAIPRKAWEDRIHPATRTFQAIRIAVNDELNSLQKCLHDTVPLLRSGGRIVVISFHSLEDRIVKQFFRDKATGCRCPKGLPVCACGGKPVLKVLTGRPVMASDGEIASNPRSRSAKLRAAEKC
ncbi:ribosomal RNA small subunit methyltransferase H [Geobacter sp. OR-1]|uniref:16S rRNA (cytosine(1402)-N(4))-methyltransferase RsmH n=1 Tax=Geobacter sp. OR-1 TaxID=1266765 RepID=UPI000542F095|nr:16S rRNA (cytosine(1402)-N(4))-methyltransferase RsmH [Geobacter sp. OR-1]GAM09520.1 ribosomal RNA small subunit methyltransferase H [Geobacter sp. OR-1]